MSRVMSQLPLWLHGVPREDLNSQNCNLPSTSLKFDVDYIIEGSYFVNEETQINEVKQSANGALFSHVNGLYQVTLQGLKSCSIFFCIQTLFSKGKCKVLVLQGRCGPDGG